MLNAANCFYAGLLLLCLQLCCGRVFAASNAPQFVHFHELAVEPYPDGSPFEPTLSFHQIGNDPFLTVADGHGCRAYRVDRYHNYPREPEEWVFHEEVFFGSPSGVTISNCMLHRPREHESDFLWVQYAECSEGSVHCVSPIYERTGQDTYTGPVQSFTTPGVRECQGIPNGNEVFCACFKNDTDQDTYSPVYAWNGNNYVNSNVDEILESITGVDAYHFKMRASHNGLLSSDGSKSPIYLYTGSAWTARLNIPLPTLTVSGCELSNMLHPACVWATIDTGTAELWCHDEQKLEMEYAGSLEIGNTRRVRCLDREWVEPSYAIQALDHPTTPYSILYTCNPVGANARISCVPYDTGFPRARDVDVFVHTDSYWPQIIAFLENREEEGYVFSFYTDSDISASPPPSEPPSSSEDTANGEDIAILFAVIVVPIVGTFICCCMVYCCRFKRPSGEKFQGDNCLEVIFQAVKEAMVHLLDPVHEWLLSVVNLPQFRWLCLLLVAGSLVANICFLVVLNLASVFGSVVIMLCLYICLTAEKQGIQLTRFDRVMVLLGLVLSYIFFGLALMAIYEDSDKESEDLGFGIASFIAISPLYFKLVKGPATKLWHGEENYDQIQ